MELKTFPKVFFILLITFCLFYSCGKDDDTNQVCCGSEIQTNPDFGFFFKGIGRDSIYWMEFEQNDTFYNTTSSSGSKLYFRAKSPKMRSYEWKVGLDPSTFTDSLFFLTFSNINESIDVTLDVTHIPNLDCFPDDNGEASLTKSINLTTWSLDDPIPIWGKYEGFVEDNPNEIFTIETNDLSSQIFNFPNGCDPVFDFVFVVRSHREFRFDEKKNASCGRPSGKGWLEDGNQTLIIEYYIDDINDPTQRVFKRFIGQRVL